MHIFIDKYTATHRKLYEYREKKAKFSGDVEVIQCRKEITRLMNTLDRGSIAESILADHWLDDYVDSACNIMLEAGAAKIIEDYYIFSDDSGISTKRKS